MATAGKRRTNADRVSWPLLGLFAGLFIQLTGSQAQAQGVGGHDMSRVGRGVRCGGELRRGEQRLSRGQLRVGGDDMSRVGRGVRCGGQLYGE